MAGSDCIGLAWLAAEPFVMRVSGSSIHQHILVAYAAAGFCPLVRVAEIVARSCANGVAGADRLRT